jgi:hypothetical protein
MELNTDKTKDMWIGFTKSCPAPPNISIGDETIERVTKFKHLGVNLFRQGLQESKSREKYKTYNLLQNDKVHSGIRGTNLPIGAGLPHYLKEETEKYN